LISVLFLYYFPFVFRKSYLQTNHAARRNDPGARRFCFLLFISRRTSARHRLGTASSSRG